MYVELLIYRFTAIIVVLYAKAYGKIYLAAQCASCYFAYKQVNLPESIDDG